jgi:hypothetical protein
VIIPSHGGSFDYTVRVNNFQAAPVNCDVWFEAVLPNGQTYPLMNVPLTLPANYATSRLRMQSVPAGAPAGDYAYRAHIGLYPTPWATDGFIFSKIGVGSLGLGIGEWTSSGDAFDEWAHSPPGRTPLQPEEFEISVSPNPFNPVTVASFQLRAASYVSLRVYDIGGRLVEELVNGWQPAGRHKVAFDGSGVASGIYIYRLEAGEFKASGKIVLMK